MSKITRLTGEERSEAGRLHLREIPAEAEAPLDTVGQDLRAARLRLGDELGHISQALRIRKDYLEALESDLPDKLPGRTYAIGFVRSYAAHLGLDAPALVSRYKLQTAEQNEASPWVGPPPEPDGRRFGLAWKASAVVAVGLIVYGVFELSRPTLPGAYQDATIHATANRTGPRVSAPRSRPPFQRRTAGDSVQRPPAIPSETTVNGAPGLAASGTAVALPVAPPVGQVFGAQNRDVRVVIRARGLAHVLVEGFGGRVYINRLLHPGDVYRVPNLVGLSLTTPDGGAVGLELDGRDMGTAGRPGQIKETLSLDPQAIVDRKSGAGPE